MCDVNRSWWDAFCFKLSDKARLVVSSLFKLTGCNVVQATEVQAILLLSLIS